MKSLQYNRYGGPDVLELNQNAPIPELKPNYVLVKVASSSINPFDYKLRRGYMQKMIPLTFPVTIGGDFSGKIIKVSEGVSEFKIGDEVYGQALILTGASGAMAEYLTTSHKNIAHKPKSLSFEEASALPLVAISALLALQDLIHLQKGQKILIHGGGGGIGHLSIQLAKSIGAYIATTISSGCVEFAKNLGADVVIDYQTQKFTELIKDYDAVFDTVGDKVTDDSFLVLKKGGILVSMTGQPNQELAQKYQVTAIGQNTKIDTSHLLRLNQLVETRALKVHIEKVFPLVQAREAFKYKEADHHRGKVVVKIK